MNDLARAFLAYAEKDPELRALLLAGASYVQETLSKDKPKDVYDTPSVTDLEHIQAEIDDLLSLELTDEYMTALIDTRKAVSLAIATYRLSPLPNVSRVLAVCATMNLNLRLVNSRSPDPKVENFVTDIQSEFYRWIGMAAKSSRSFIKRHMSIQDPPTEEEVDEAREMIHELHDKIDERS